ncbi:hypothetical protein IAQ61_010483 [Plenodomus lingam]|uniref:uncharacterized protein n=1 Tax=Leptosphaeria maculans TaxID=5022 RepID=UPI00331F6217|nr:hypothetical protein IAQ61_010483 [Plenodomus lingam]
MPAERRQFQLNKPVKTERTHEENQERAYIAASRRSDRSLEARIESARRASEIHKRRTGRGLRVTEQDVINEEMYEEEDDDLPTQYQRLNAHLHTTSVMFNKKLHDYIATQHGVRNMFMSQYQTPPYQQAAGPSAGPMPQAQANNWLNPSMLPPQQMFNPSNPQGIQQTQHFPSSPGAPQGFRQSPYYIPQRTHSHQRSLSIQMPTTANFEAVSPQVNSAATTPQGETTRRMSLPPHAFQQQANTPVDVKPQQLALSQSQSPVLHQLSASPQVASSNDGSVHQSPLASTEAGTPNSMTFSPVNYPYSSQVLNSNPLTMSMPPETQQFIGSAMDPDDPRTALFMSGSDSLPQPFAPTYTYNPNPKTRIASSMANLEQPAGSAQTLSPDLSLKLENEADTVPSDLTSISAGFYNTDSFLTPGNGDYNAFFDFTTGDSSYNGDDHAGTDQLDGNNFVDWDKC